jgi:hypothetical protein
MTHPEPPQIWPEHPLRHRARAILSYVAGLEGEPLEKRLAALDAYGELTSVVPAHAIPPFITPVQGTLTDVWALFTQAFSTLANTGVRDELSMAHAADLLRPWIDTPTDTQPRDQQGTRPETPPGPQR